MMEWMGWIFSAYLLLGVVLIDIHDSTTNWLNRLFLVVLWLPMLILGIFQDWRYDRKKRKGGR